MAGNKSHRIVIRRPPTHEEERHSGSWKIAYADFMTAMMAFFLVMWLLTLVPKDELPTIAEFFKRPLLSVSPIKGNTSSPNIIPGGSPSVIPNQSGSEMRLPESQDYNRSTGSNGEAKSEKMQLEDLKTQIETLIATNPRLKEFKPQMVLDMTPEGLMIQIVDGRNRPMFDVGSANMRPDMHTILTELAGTLNNIPNQISIAGHTDATQYATGERYYSNWELSADRANAARRSLVAGGLAENKVQSIMGLGSRMGASENPYDHGNRRITIIVMSQESMNRLRRTFANMAKPADVASKVNEHAQVKEPAPVWPPQTVEEPKNPFESIDKNSAELAEQMLMKWVAPTSETQ